MLIYLFISRTLALLIFLAYGEKEQYKIKKEGYVKKDGVEKAKWFHVVLGLFYIILFAELVFWGILFEQEKLREIFISDYVKGEKS